MSFEACFNKLPVLETPRLRLRQITPNPEEGLECLEFINDYNVYRYWGLYDEARDTTGRHRPKKKVKPDYHYNTTLKEYRARRELAWLLEARDTGRIVGEIVLYDFNLKKQADIGYRINQKYWGRGFTPEAGQAMLKVAFEYMELNRLQIRCFSNNENSIRVAQKLGFQKEGLIRQGALLNVITDYYIFGLIREDYGIHPVSDQTARIVTPDL